MRSNVPIDDLLLLVCVFECLSCLVLFCFVFCFRFYFNVTNKKSTTCAVSVNILVTSIFGFQTRTATAEHYGI